MANSGVLASVHAYYPELAEDILRRLAESGAEARLLVTTDSDDKAALLRQMLDDWRLNGEVVVVPNRGRDIAPFIIEGRKHLSDAKYVAHFHTKKSPHDGRYAHWRDFMLDNLLGSEAIVRSVLAVLASDDVGVVYSEHFAAVEDLRNWGFDYPLARTILAKLGVTITTDQLLEFPSGSMFWARREAIEPLFSLGLDYGDFEIETGQTDGTLAHALERCVLYVAELQGFRHVRVRSRYDILEGAPPMTQRDLRYMLRRRSPLMAFTTHGESRFSEQVREIYPVAVARSRASAPRLNLVVPTVSPEKIYGGVATALRFTRALTSAVPDHEIRILLTSDIASAAAVDETARRLGQPVVVARVDDEVRGTMLVSLPSDRARALPIRDSDVFVATAWWTADLALRLRDTQHAIFGNERHIVYLIQDFEPGFYQWSSRYALAEATYTRGADTIAVMNSPELANYMSARYSFAAAFHLPYVLNAEIGARLRLEMKEKRILVYGRPSTPRNMFEIIVEGLRLWQGRSPSDNAAFEVSFVGEDFPRTYLSDLENATVRGKLPLDEYAGMLSRSAIGIAMMLSPHPSYPPLEMAAAGCLTITNRYDSKDLGLRSDNVLSVSAVTPMSVADALDVAVSRLPLSTPDHLPCDLRDVPTVVPPVDYKAIAALVTAS